MEVSSGPHLSTSLFNFFLKKFSFKDSVHTSDPFLVVKKFILTREDDSREPIPHTWPSSNDYFLDLIVAILF